jgi:xanthine dehydrogenase accessory factor
MPALPAALTAAGSVLIPAAGGARRMLGEDKLLRRIDGIAQIRRIALNALATGWPVIVTLPEGNRARRAALAGLEVTLLEVADHAEGMAASLRRGAGAARGGALMVVPADMPDLTGEDLARLCRRHGDMPQAILRATSLGRPGHPVLFPSDLVAGIGQLSGDTGASPLLARHADRVTRVPLPGERALRDLDTPADWAAWETARGQEQGFQPGTGIVPDPLADLLDRTGEAVIAIITGVEGPSYRNPGTLMCLFPDGTASGSLTNGCIEADLALHAQTALRSGRPLRLRYGIGSPFFDIRLPCGGGLDICLFPLRDRTAVADAAFVLQGRAAVGLAFAPDGTMRLAPAGPSGWSGGTFVLTLVPQPQAMIFGDGLEAQALARLFHAAGFRHLLAANGGHGALCLADPWTAIVTLYHDHEKELDILAQALRGPAFYVGAQGSRRVQEARAMRLRDAGLHEAEIARSAKPCGLGPCRGGVGQPAPHRPAAFARVTAACPGRTDAWDTRPDKVNPHRMAKARAFAKEATRTAPPTPPAAGILLPRHPIPAAGGGRGCAR